MFPELQGFNEQGQRQNHKKTAVEHHQVKEGGFSSRVFAASKVGLKTALEPSEHLVLGYKFEVFLARSLCLPVMMPELSTQYAVFPHPHLLFTTSCTLARARVGPGNGRGPEQSYP
jgi:hypothetical protein